MDVYGGLLVDDLLDLPLDLPNDNDLIFSSNSSSTSSSAPANTSASHFHHHHHHHHPSAATYFQDSPLPTTYNSTDFTDALFIPTEDAAELEWVSNYMDDSYADFPTNTLTATTYNAAFHGRARTKRSRPPTTNPDRLNDIVSRNRNSSSTNSYEDTVARRCSHCASEKTPQWRTGPMGPKTLCNACGVRYKSGRLVPEYRPAASPTFVLTQHSNSHRKVMELRRQKEVIRHHHHHVQHMQQ